jgi:DNA repair protein RecO
MHHIHHTTGFVIGHADIKEADRLFFLFTRELGVIYAIAQGIRKETSRLRYSLQDFSYTRIDLVHGKEMWRITSAKKIETEELANNKEYTAMFARILELVRRLCQGEEAVEPIFDSLEQLLHIFEQEKSIDRESLLGLEYITVINILYELGYLAPEGVVASYVLGDLSLVKASEAFTDRIALLQIITRTLGETQL